MHKPHTFSNRKRKIRPTKTPPTYSPQFNQLQSQHESPSPCSHQYQKWQKCRQKYCQIKHKQRQKIPQSSLQQSLQLQLQLQLQLSLQLQLQLSSLQLQQIQLKQIIKRIIIDEQFVYCQNFVAHCDIRYFRNNCMRQIFDSVFGYQMEKDKEKEKDRDREKEIGSPNQGNFVVKLKEFKVLQKSLPKPQLFKRKQLQKIRNQVRSQAKLPVRDLFGKIFQKRQEFIQIGSKIWSFCPLCQLFHSGTVLSHYKQSYLINFSQPNLGALKIPEERIANHLSPIPPFCQITQSLIPSMSSPQKQQINLLAFSIFLQLLECKQKLITLLKQFHNLVQKRRQSSKSKPKEKDKEKFHASNKEKTRNFVNGGWLTEQEIQAYGWVGCMINIIHIATKWIENFYSVKIGTNRQTKDKNKNKLPYLYLSNTYTKRSSVQTDQIEQNKQQSQQNSPIQIQMQMQMQMNMPEQNEQQKQKQKKHKFQQNKQIQVEQIAKLSINILQNLKNQQDKFNLQLDPNLDRLKQHFPMQVQLINKKINNIKNKIAKN